MFKKVISFFAITLLLFSLCACDINEVITDARDAIFESEGPTDITTSNITVENSDGYRIFTMEDYNVSFTVPKDWYVDMEDATLDMFCENGKVYMGVFGYHTCDFSAEADYLRIWEDQNEGVLEEYSNVNQIDHTPKFDSKDKELKTALYSSEIKDVKQYSYFVFAKPKTNANTFLWIQFSGLPSNILNNFEMLEDIVDSIEFK